MAGRLPRAGLLIALALLSLSFGLSDFSFSPYLLWAAALLCTISVAGEWLVEDLQLTEQQTWPGISPGRRRWLRLSTPAFWAFPLLMMFKSAPAATIVAAVVITLGHLALRRLSRLSSSQSSR